MTFLIIGSSLLPIRFQADREGQYECCVFLRSGYDLRAIYIEATATAEERFTQIEFNTQAIQPLTQNVPVVNIYVKYLYIVTIHNNCYQNVLFPGLGYVQETCDSRLPVKYLELVYTIHVL